MAKKFYGTLQLVPLTNQKALVCDASGNISEATTTSTELDFLSGVTSAVQTQIDGKEALISGATAAAIASGDTLAFTDIDDSNNTKKITLANLESTLNHDSLAGYVANEHIDHSAVLMNTNADSGLTGGGDLTASRTLSVDITGTTAVGTLAGTDEILIYDVDGTVLRKTTAQAIADLGSAHPVSHFKTDWLDTDGATKTITHSLGSTDVVVQIYDKATGDTILVDDVQRTDANTVDVTASQAPPATDWRVLILSLD